MNWEVKTMLSKRSCFNWGIFKKNMQRFWLLPLGFFFLLYSVVLNGAFYDAEFDRNVMQGVVRNEDLMVFASFFFGCLAAMCSFSYLWSNKSAYMLHALPVTRGSLFITNYLSGLTMLVIPILLTGLGLLFCMLLTPYVEIAVLLRYLAKFLIIAIFFYSFAVLCAQLTGFILAMPVLYAVLNFTVVVVEALVRAIAEVFIYGLTGAMNTISLTKFSPAVELLMHNNYYYGKDAGILMSGWDYLFALLAVSAVIIALAFLLYKKRHLESAGDVISHSFLRPVFKYCFTFGCAVVLGSFFYYFIWNTNNATSAIAYIVSLLIGGFIGYFAAEMMLKKRFRVFVAGYKGFLASSAVIMAICGMFYFDLFGVAGNVPTADKIAEMHVQVSTANGSQFFTYTLDDETQPLTVVEMQAVEDWLAVHELLISEKDIVNEFQQMLNEGAYPTVDYDPYPIYDKSKTIEELVLVPADELNLDHYRMRGISFNYYLKNGSQISRYYRIPVSELILADSSSSAWQVQTLINRGELLKYRNLEWLEVAPDDINLMYLGHDKDEVKIYGEDAILLLEAVQKDIEQGKIGKAYISNTAEFYRESTILWLRVEYTVRDENSDITPAQWTEAAIIDILAQSENTVRALQQLGQLGK